MPWLSICIPDPRPTSSVRLWGLSKILLVANHTPRGHQLCPAGWEEQLAALSSCQHQALADLYHVQQVLPACGFWGCAYSGTPAAIYAKSSAGCCSC